MAGPGNDTLYGGTGNDLMIGGAGNDTLHGGPVAGTDGDAVNTFFFDRGDGSDRIEMTQRPAGTAGTRCHPASAKASSKSQVSIINTAGTGSTRNELVIEYGTADRITLAPGAETQIAEIRFADGSTMSRSEIIGRLLGVQTAGDDVIHGTEWRTTRCSVRQAAIGCSDTVATTRWMAGRTAIGSLAAPAPTRMYSTLIAAPTSSMRRPANRQALFAQTPITSLSARIDGADLVVRQPGGGSVRIVGFAADSNSRSNWHVADGLGTKVSLSTLISAATA